MVAGVAGMGMTARTGRGIFERESIIGPDAEVEITAVGDGGRCVHGDGRDRVIRVEDRSNANDW